MEVVLVLGTSCIDPDLCWIAFRNTLCWHRQGRARSNSLHNTREIMEFHVRNLVPTFLRTGEIEEMMNQGTTGRVSGSVSRLCHAY